MPVQAPVAVAVPEPLAAVAGSEPAVKGIKDNNYSRPSGQNVGNFITEKPSSRVLAPPGGALHLLHIFNTNLVVCTASTNQFVGRSGSFCCTRPLLHLSPLGWQWCDVCCR